MALAAVAAGADGLIVEVHPDPEHALSDGAQSLNPVAFADMMARCRRVAEAVGKEMDEGVEELADRDERLVFDSRP
jgi:3-deoxy-7-phosphoheptulonate synthase